MQNGKTPENLEDSVMRILGMADTSGKGSPIQSKVQTSKRLEDPLDFTKPTIFTLSDANGSPTKSGTLVDMKIATQAKIVKALENDHFLHEVMDGF